MKKFLILLAAILFANVLFAQNSDSRLHVRKFELIPNDTEASRAKKKDGNGDKCALIKIQTPNMNEAERNKLVIDADRGTFVYPEPAVGELKIYLTEGVKILVIKHPDYGVLNYNVNENVEGNKVYKLVLEADKLTQPTKPSIQLNSNYVNIKVTPPDAIISIDGQFYTKGNIKLTVDQPHALEVSHPLYQPYEQTIYASAEKKMSYEVNLAPAFGWLNITSKPEDSATVLIDKKRVGVTPFRSDTLKSGEYEVTLLKDMYENVTKTVVIRDNNVCEVDLQMKPCFAEITLESEYDAEIFIDGSKVGWDSWTGRLGTGNHLVEVKKWAHRDFVKTIEVIPGKNDTIKIIKMEPICGALDISTDPQGADVYLYGLKIGETPLIKDSLLIGNYVVNIDKEGCVSSELKVSIEEGKITEVSDVLKTGLTTSVQELSSGNKVFTINGVSFEMVAVKGGTFKMGGISEQGEFYDEKPVHDVTLSDYYIGKFEVTQALWQAVMGTTILQQRDKSNISWPLYGVGDNSPMYYVSYNEVLEFVRILNRFTGEHFRLPTEAEWEYAARGGNKSKGYKYSGSNSIKDVARYEVTSNKTGTHPVGTKLPNELGIYDMSGNLMEFCQDWFGGYYSDSQINPAGAPRTGTGLRAVRGGSWNSKDNDCRVYAREWSCIDGNQNIRKSIYGFRLAMIPSVAPVVTPANKTVTYLKGVFSVSETKKVNFSKGNIQYQASTKTWQFAENQWDVIGESNKNISSSYKGWIDLFGWGTGDDPSRCLICSSYWNVEFFHDWGNNVIVNGGNKNWRTLTYEEWDYLLEKRNTNSGIRYAKAIVNNIKGVILLPDNWNSATYTLYDTNNSKAHFDSNPISKSDWNKKLEANGAVFLPAAGWRLGTSVYGAGTAGVYWSSSFFSIEDFDDVYHIGFDNFVLDASSISAQGDGRSVRLVCDVEK